NDFYPTPADGTRALLSVESFTGPIWECACGDGAISRELIDAGYEVVGNDLVDRGYGEAPVDFPLEWRARAPNLDAKDDLWKLSGRRQAVYAKADLVVAGSNRSR